MHNPHTIRALLGAIVRGALNQCPLLGVKQTSVAPSPMSAFLQVLFDGCGQLILVVGIDDGDRE
jgi:hypothetical protein